MKLAAISNSRTKYRVRVHKAGCRDIQRELHHPYSEGVINNENQDFASQEEFGLDYWSDINSDQEEGATAYIFEDIEFMPCTKDLPVYKKESKIKIEIGHDISASGHDYGYSLIITRFSHGWSTGELTKEDLVKIKDEIAKFLKENQ